MFSHTAWTTIRMGLAGAVAGLTLTVGLVSIASAYETGYGPVQLVSMTESSAAQCPASDTYAGITRGYVPEYPEIALQLGLEGASLVTFNMGIDGGISDVKLAGTSGNRSFDIAALDAVKRSHFSPAVQNCSKIGGVYGVRVVFEHPTSTQSGFPVLPVGGNGPTFKQ